MTIKRFWSGVVTSARREVGRIGTNTEYRALLLWLPLGVVLFFALFFSKEVVGALPIAVVDEDGSYLSRRVVMMIKSTPQTALVKEVGDMVTAHRMLLQGEVVGVVEIPNGFAQNILTGDTTEVIYYDSGTNISTNSLSAKGVQTAIASFGVGVALQRAEIGGAMPDEAMAQVMPIRFSIYFLMF